MIKIISGYSHAAGSTLALVNLCNEFNSRGHVCTLYGPDNWHIDKCMSGKLAEFSPQDNDTIIVNDISLLSIGDLSNIRTNPDKSIGGRLQTALRKYGLKYLPSINPPNYRLVLTRLSDGGLPLSSMRFSLFQKIHFSSSALNSYSQIKFPIFIAPNISNDLGKTEHKPKKTAGVIGSIKKQNNIEIAVEQALLDGMEAVIIYGYMKDPVYFYTKIVPLTIKYPGKIKYAGFVDDRQKMYDAVSDVYSSANKPWSLVSRECEMTNTIFHAPASRTANYRMTNDQIFEIWKNELAL